MAFTSAHLGSNSKATGSRVPVKQIGSLMALSAA